MNSPMLRSSRAVSLVIAAVLLAGCVNNGMQTARYGKPDAGLSGIPYNLPTAVIEVRADFQRTASDGDVESSGNRDDIVTWNISARRVPDPDAVFYLDPNGSAWVESDQHVTLHDGLISSIQTTDDGRGGAVLNNAVRSAINLAKVGVAIAQSEGDENPFLTASPLPTEAEIEALIQRVKGQSHMVSIGAPGTESNSIVPGTSGVLYVTTPGSESSAPQASGDVENTPATDYLPGVYARTLREYVQKVEMRISMSALRRLRRAEISEASARASALQEDSEREEELQSSIATSRGCGQLGKAIGGVKAQLDLHSMLPEQNEVRISALRSQLAELKARRAGCREIADRKREFEFDARKKQDEIDRLALLEMQNSETGDAKDVLLSSARALLMVPADNAVRIPVDRAWIGRTTNQLTFDRGVLVDFDRHRPAELQVATEGLVTATQTLYDGLIEVLRTPLTVIGIEVEQAIAETDLTERQILLRERQDQLEGMEAEIRQIDRQVQLELHKARLARVEEDPQAYLGELRPAAQFNPLPFAVVPGSPDPDPDAAESEESSESEPDAPEAVAGDEGGEEEQAVAEPEPGSAVEPEPEVAAPDEDMTEEVVATQQRVASAFAELVASLKELQGEVSGGGGE